MRAPAHRSGASRTRALGFLSLLVAILAIGCGSSSSAETDLEETTNPTDVHAEVSEFISTVVNVHWKTDRESKGYVEYGPTEALGLNTPIGEELTIDHTQTLVGLRSDTVYYYRVVVWDGADAGRSEIESVRTGYLPPGMPQLELEGSGHDEFIVTPIIGQSKGVLILDPEGQIVWYDSEEDEGLEYYRARLARDGKSVLYNVAHFSGVVAENSEIRRVSFDGGTRSSTFIPFLAHDFVELPDGTIAAMTIEDRDMDGERVRGNRLVEVDADGNQKDVWNSWDCFDPVEDPGDDPELGWTFSNALDYDANLDVYYVGLRNFSSITRVNRQTRECEWVLGFTAPTIEFSPDSATFEHQHQFHFFSGNHLLVMDNDGSLTPQESRVLEYEIDFDTNIATEVWRYLSNPTVYTYVLGEPTRYPNGDTFINWSTAGQMERVTADGESIWKLNSKAGGVFGFDTLAKNLYEP